MFASRLARRPRRRLASVTSLSTLLLVVVGLSLAGADARAQSGDIFLRKVAPARAASARGPTAAFVTVDPEAVRRFRAAGGGPVAVPLADGSSLEVTLAKFEVLAPGAVVTLTGDAGPVPYQPDLTLFKGTVAGEPRSLAVLAMTSEQVTGIIQRAGAQLVIAPLDTRGADHAVADAADLPFAPPPFVCATEDLPRVAPDPPPDLAPLPADVQASTLRLVCDMALDCDYEFFTKEGSDAARAANYALVMLGTTSAIYERDINVALEASYLNVWTTSADPYSASSLGPALDEFVTWWNANRTGVSRDEAQLVSGRSLGGGIAYINTLCNQSYGYSVIGNLNGNNLYPTNTTTWDINVMAHELGHSFSSRHTHSCWWQSNGYAPAGALLDSCYTAEGSCYSGGTGQVPPDKGTIMSYCHLASGGENNIRLDFHTACKSVMRNAAEISCFSTATVQPPRNLTATVGASGTALDWTASSSAGVIRYDVFRSAYQLDLNPTMIGFTAGTSFTDLDLGTFFYKVRAVRSADSSAFCGEVKATMCAPSAPVQYSAGSQPLAVVAADFNEDGILDLATANYAGDNVSILLGQGSGGVGNGTFAAPVNYAVPAGSFPAALATGDFNGDGILDLAVVDQEGAAVSVLFGQGSGGVGNGTFVAGPQLGVGAGPAAIAVGDFNADAIPDLVVACASGTVSVRLGNGTNDLPNGTFAPAVNYLLGMEAHGVTTGDFNADGITDLAVAGGSGVSVLLGNGTGGKGDGTFGAKTTYPCQSFPYGVTTGDFNADGITDLAVTNSNSGTVSILLGDGTGGHGDGTFAPAASYACGASPGSVAVGDWTGDGIADLAVPNGGTAGTISILTGDETGGVPDGTFGAKQSFTAGSQAQWVALGDFSGDGTADFAVARAVGPGKVAVLLASCLSALSTTLQVTSPSGGPQWITGHPYTIAWTKGAGVLAVDVALSRDGGANWQTIGRNITNTSWVWNAAGPYTKQARIRVYDPSVPGHTAINDSSFTIIPASLVDAGDGLPSGLALRGAWPNPAREQVRVWFTLAGDAPARLELLDLAGRRVRAMEVGHMGSGLHSVELDPTPSLRPGLYFVRLSQAGRHAAMRLVVTR